MTRKRALMIGELELAARPCMNPASILWPAWPEGGRRPHAGEAAAGRAAALVLQRAGAQPAGGRLTMARHVPMLRHMARPTNHSVMTPARLATIGEALLGPQWQRELARELGCSDRQVRYFASGERPITREWADRITAIARARSATLARLVRQLEGDKGK